MINVVQSKQDELSKESLYENLLIAINEAAQFKNILFNIIAILRSPCPRNGRRFFRFDFNQIYLP